MWQTIKDYWNRYKVGRKIVFGMGVLVFVALIAYLYLASNEESGVFPGTATLNETLATFDAGRGDSFLKTMDRDGTRTLIWLLAGIVGWYFLLERTEAAKQSVGAAYRNVGIAEQSLTTERLARAVEQLNSDSSSVRMGGIFSLEQMAKAGVMECDHIVQILTARVCELAPIKDGKTKPEIRNRRQDIETAVKVMSRLVKAYRDNEDIELVFDLEKTDLRGLHLRELHMTFFQLQSADLSGANLESSFLNGANLEGGNLGNAILKDAFFTDADLQNVDFTGAELSAHLHNANLSGANFQDVKGLTQQQLKEAYHWKGQPPQNLPLGLKPPPERDPGEDSKP